MRDFSRSLSFPAERLFALVKMFFWFGWRTISPCWAVRKTGRRSTATRFMLRPDLDIMSLSWGGIIAPLVWGYGIGCFSRDVPVFRLPTCGFAPCQRRKRRRFVSRSLSGDGACLKELFYRFRCLAETFSPLFWRSSDISLQLVPYVALGIWTGIIRRKSLPRWRTA